ncbi:MAG: sugar phosphate isomerase/epimerase [Oscillospiraceae bacterium]|nr:sugar phosphate isomerase/epimerase [Oscillospiraceae bacterium]
MINTNSPFYISTIAQDAENIARKYGLGLEIAEFCSAYNMDPGVSTEATEASDESAHGAHGLAYGFESNDRIVREKMHGVKHCVFHAPFNELCPAAIDPLIVAVAKRRYAQAYDIMNGYGIHQMVAHSGFVPLIYFPEWFVEKSVIFWREFLADKPEGFKLYLENVLEDRPDMLIEIASKVDDKRFKLCLDVGHAAIVGTDIPITAWAEQMRPHLGHAHLHNNDGRKDTHNAPGDGIIDVNAVIRTVQNTSPEITFTLEVIDAVKTAEWMTSNGHI